MKPRVISRRTPAQRTATTARTIMGFGGLAAFAAIIGNSVAQAMLSVLMFGGGAALLFVAQREH